MEFLNYTKIVMAKNCIYKYNIIINFHLFSILFYFFFRILIVIKYNNR